jgi:hypothetical protein
MSSPRNRRLIRKYGGEVIPYRDLSLPAQKAVAHYMAIDGEAWELPEGFELKHFPESIPWFVERYGDVLFGYVEIPMKELTKTVLQDPELVDEGIKTFEQYHEWYMRTPMPDHPKKNLWPVILSSDDYETLQDGWHRFHDYYRKGIKVVPAVYYP